MFSPNWRWLQSNERLCPWGREVWSWTYFLILSIGLSSYYWNRTFFGEVINTYCCFVCFYFVLYVWMFPWTCVSVPCIFLVPMEAAKECWVSLVWSDLQYDCWELNSHPLQEQQALFITKPFFQPVFVLCVYVCVGVSVFRQCHTFWASHLQWLFCLSF